MAETAPEGDEQFDQVLHHYYQFVAGKRQERAERLADALTKLPVAEYQAVTSKHIHGLAVAEVAEHLGRTPEEVAGLLREGTKRLRFLPSEFDSYG